MKLLHVDFMSSFPYHILLKSDKKIIQFLLPYIFTSEFHFALCGSLFFENSIRVKKSAFSAYLHNYLTTIKVLGV